MRTTSTRRYRALAVLVALGLATACGGGGGGGGGDADGPIRLGTVDALTGAYAVLGAQVKDGVQAAVDSVNRDGGLLGRQVELTSLDNQSSPTKAQQQITELVTRYDVAAVLGPEDATAIGATVPVAARTEIPNVVSSAAWPNGLGPEDTAWSFTATANTQDGIDSYIDYFEQNGIARVAIIGNGTPFAQQLPTYLDSLEGTLPFEVVASEQFSPGAVDVSPQLLRAASADPDFVLSWVSGTDQVNVIKTYQRLGSDVPLGINGGNAGSAVRAAVGDADLEGVFALSYPTQLLADLPDTFASREAAQAYLDGMAASGLDADGGASNAVLGWDAAMSLMQAIEEAGSTDPQAIRGALENQQYVGATTVWNRTPDDHGGAEPGGYVLAQSQGGRWTLVPTAATAQG